MISGLRAIYLVPWSSVSFPLTFAHRSQAHMMGLGHTFENASGIAEAGLLRALVLPILFVDRPIAEKV